jgi:MYXO-CTERM domain-containing protein
MKRRNTFAALTAISALTGLMTLTAFAGDARALSKRVEVIQQGDFALIGNTLAHDCRVGVPAPTVGTVDCSAAGFTNDFAPDIQWRSEAGGATTSASITPELAQSSAVLTLPEGAAVTSAHLYWAGYKPGAPDGFATILCETQGGAPIEASALSSATSFSGTYGALADVTSYVQMNGSCTYTVGGVDSVAFSGAQPQPVGYTGWWMVVLYTLPSAPHRFLAVYDGLDSIGNGGDSIIPLTGFTVPKGFASFSSGRIGVAAFDGDSALLGDQILLSDVALEDVPGNGQNFFDSSRSILGAPFSMAGDLPQLAGTPGSMSRMDIDIVDITSRLVEGQAQADIKAVSIGDPFDLTGVVASIPAFTDADGDTLSDDEETRLGMNPADTDSDDDGVLDNLEGCSNAKDCPSPGYSDDTDADGVINALDPDSDGDGLFDGTELGLDCNAKDTTKAAGHCIPDGDEGATTTDPLAADTDGGGVKDGSEDINLNGILDTGETDPTAGHGDDDSQIVDTDKDGLSDGLEETIGSDKNDADTDDDGLLDGQEIDPSLDTDDDGLPNVRDVDSDNDALYDGTEAGKGCGDPATSGVAQHCIADADPNTTTAPVLADTDGGGARDGGEDANRDGAISAGEMDPSNADDDALVADTDSDGLSDDLEIDLGSTTNDTDSDDDGVPDGIEANPADDHDGDGTTDVLDEDSDNDALKDGTELGYACTDPAIDKTKLHCVADGDKGSTKTSMVDADTDDGGVLDGEEDKDKDGMFDATQGEGNPLDPSDDYTICLCNEDSACGPPNSGKVCDSDSCGFCIDGCRGVNESGCPDGQVCSSQDENIGYCMDGPGPGSGSGGSGANGAGGSGSGEGCQCGVQADDDGSDSAWALLAVGAAAGAWRRRRRARAGRR